MKKKIILFSSVLFMGSMFSCNKDELRFKDYDYTTIYFPYQYPVRTLVLGDYDLAENTNDNKLQFLISARVGGMYENNSNWNVGYQVDNSLANNLLTDANLWDGKTASSSDTLEALPEHYYTLTGHNGNNIIIPKGSFYGSIEVQLTQDFLDDPKSWTTHYVIPVRIISATADSILSGIPNVENPDPRIASDWSIVPMNFAIFGIKFVNAYHGSYLHKGKSVITDAGGSIAQTIQYSTPYIENNEIWQLQTTGKNKVSVTGVLRSSPTSPGNFKMDIVFNDEGNCTISASPGSAFPVTGNGKLVKDGESWGGKARNTIYLSYEVTEGVNKHSITDTLVFRDKGVAFQQYVPVIIP